MADFLFIGIILFQLHFTPHISPFLTGNYKLLLVIFGYFIIIYSEKPPVTLRAPYMSRGIYGNNSYFLGLHFLFFSHFSKSSLGFSPIHLGTYAFQLLLRQLGS